MKRLGGKVALVTGAARGIGRATAALMAEEGARVVIADRDGAEETARSLGEAALPLVLDVTDADQVNDAVARILARYGQIDVLVNNAGITRDATLAKTSDAAWDQVLAVNLTGTFN